jgi:sulfopyruvate decarboxylase subunit beta
MNRQEVIETVLQAADEHTIIVSNIADASFELCALGDRARNFYMLGSLGLAPSIGLGLALSQRDPVIVINGDGALLFNMGCLATMGRYQPNNLIHVVVDNEAHGATGYQPTATGVGTDLAQVAVACNHRAQSVEDGAGLAWALSGLLARRQSGLIVAKVRDFPAHSAPLVPYSGEQIRARFMNALRTSHVADQRQVA